ncbi:GNAT family N-acetyltransferase [Luteipulveratus halotolerans]|uniref:Acetyltransferase n=1 Tax=Luteipulveratus halotolerans TaxID=1631356 RepID=A0A0L6CH26_9MICO|nr:GNAT family protein [Luteipulveratus halotolerans]KNX37107.1 acetyltransferase [Luteipulveratus halotolerans]
MKNYPLLEVRVTTPRLELRATTDELMDELAELVRAGKTHAEPPPYDDPITFYEPDPEVRVAHWMRRLWLRRSSVGPNFWRLNFTVVLDGRAVGEQSVTGVHFAALGTVTTFSWLSVDERGRGLGHEMRAAVLHLAFDGLGAREAGSDAFVDNAGSNAISRDLGYEPNGVDWATRRGERAQLNRWRITRAAWEPHRRDDVELYGVDACHTHLPLTISDT